jgi:hypothetical protein
MLGPRRWLSRSGSGWLARHGAEAETPAPADLHRIANHSCLQSRMTAICATLHSYGRVLPAPQFGAAVIASDYFFFFFFNGFTR